MRSDISSQPPALELRSLSKSFAGNAAVRDLNLEVHGGEIHSLVGENGAGKSTVMKMIAGIYAPDSGEILLKGRAVRLDGYDQARKAGVGLVYQELSLLPHLSVAENIFLGVWKSRFGLVRWGELHARAREALSLIGADVDPSVLAGDLPMARRQMVEIAKVLIQNPDIVILDEPTTALSADEAERLFAVMDDLRKKGCAVVFISHRLKEVLRISDRVTVMKDGVKILTEKIEFFDEDKIISLMVGRELTDIYPPKSTRGGAKEVFSFRTVPPLSGREVSFSVQEGEVLGVGGLAGQGQDALLESMFGIGSAGRSSMLLNGKALSFSSPRRAIRSSIALVPQDRNRQGGFGVLSISENISAATLRDRQTLGFVHVREERGAVAKMIGELDIHTLSKGRLSSLECRFLSGGNMQKVVFGKWLLPNPGVMILLSPTSGIDIGTKRQIYHLIRDLANRGVVVIVLSGDMIELIGLCDRVLVMSAGAVTADLSGDRLTEEEIMKASVDRGEGTGA
ncbi:MAG: sugar ABC transporter ATP-binding protein [Synergistaceae bacterium]|jgi:ribose transport system ATP-binding protein|nr:sugar ABC transporter ATP-binding protein [Synergistaceae bacterium]